MSEKFTTSERALIKEFQLEAKEDKLGKKLVFKTNLDTYDNIYERRFDVPRHTGSLRSDQFKITDFYAFKVFLGKEHIDNIDFIKFMSKKLIGEDIVTIKIKRDKVRGKYPGYWDYNFMGIKINNINKNELKDYFNFYLQTLLTDLKKDKNKVGYITGDEDSIFF
tara:strand:+ start:105 stop:599 length:495 start_codon:yes stop_codon:yes gene_type:complete